MAPAKAETPAAGGKIWDDARFAHLVSDPRFRGIPKSEKKVQIDSRFKSMFKDERFNVKAKVDKYGRKLRPTETTELRKFYELEDEDTDEEEQEREREREQRAMEGRSDGREEESEEAESDSSDDELQLTKEEKGTVLSEEVKNRLRTFADDFRRGEGKLHSSDDSSEDSSSDDEEEEDDEVFIEHVWGELDADAEHTEESSHRLAVCHMDWDRIRAVDIMVLLTSFLPPGSSVKSVKIYPSEFGKERMKEEEERGPQELTVRRDDSEEEEEDDEEAQKERLREYQLNRLKYYYAVAECDSVETADKIYKECDGVEYESTANKIDLRFIPDDMEFGEDEPKDSCTELPDMGKYVPRIFNTSALKQAKVELTWDENDLERKEFNEKLRDGKWAQMPETELKKYVACSSSDEEEARAGGKKRQKRSILRLRAPEPDDEDSDDGEAPDGKEKQTMIAKYKALLSDIKEQEQADEEDKIGMEFTWKVNGDDGGAENERQSSEKTDHQKTPLPDDVNPFEKILQKKKEKSKRRKELKKRRKRGELVEGSDGERSGSSSDSEDDLPYGVDLNDPFFASAFDEKEFGGPKQKGKKKDPEALRQTKEREEREAAEEARRQAELELLLDDGDDSRAHFNLRAIQEREIDLKAVSKSKRRRLLKKSKREIEEQRGARAMPNGGDDFEVDLDDTRFGAIYSKAEYNIDPTNPSFKKTKGMERMIDHKLKKRQLAENDARDDGEQRGAAKKQRKDVATTMLVKSIKRKIGQGT
ncbi:ESF1 homolog [Anopheles cruzii]|uniref:ESF1 homolog n=1 Tax=Anopheles cruzii TaxID=68878 RepID=UPI0022EC52FB|nr:ESF1 homolog [Anopheles cruzii]